MKLTIQFAATVSALLLSGTAFAGEELAPLQERMFDTDTGTLLFDSDADTYPDVTEKTLGTDPMDASSFPFSDLVEESSETRAAGFPRTVCRPGFRTVGRLCIDYNVQNATRYDFASYYCRNRFARVATYEDLSYLYYFSALDASYNPAGRWIGNMTGDDQVLYGNRTVSFNNDPDINNFEGTANKTQNRAYWCAHDHE